MIDKNIVRFIVIPTFSFLDNNKKVRWTYKAFHSRIEHYSVFCTKKNVTKIPSLLTLGAYRFFSSQHWLTVGSFPENVVRLLVWQEILAESDQLSWK